MLKVTKKSDDRIDIELSGSLASDEMAVGLDELIYRPKVSKTAKCCTGSRNLPCQLSAPLVSKSRACQSCSACWARLIAVLF